MVVAKLRLGKLHSQNNRSDQLGVKLQNIIRAGSTMSSGFLCLFGSVHQYCENNRHAKHGSED